jgi:hypothetical protein
MKAVGDSSPSFYDPQPVKADFTPWTSAFFYVGHWLPLQSPSESAIMANAQQWAIGMWRSLVARYLGEVEVPGSNPGIPTSKPA